MRRYRATTTKKLYLRKYHGLFNHSNKKKLCLLLLYCFNDGVLSFFNHLQAFLTDEYLLNHPEDSDKIAELKEWISKQVSRLNIKFFILYFFMQFKISF